MAARGMPLTTQLSSLCAMVMPPAALIAPRPSAPSSPMPVIRMPTDSSPNSCPTEWKSTSAEGRWPFTGGPSERTTMSPRGIRRTIMWRLPGQIRTRPAMSRSPERASCTSRGQHSSKRFANISVKPSGMCCTTSMAERKLLGICDSMYCNALGPPVEIPTAMTRRGGIFWFLEKIHRAESESFESGVTALFRMGAEKDDGQRRALHDEPQHFQTVHTRHFKVECDDVGLEFFDFLQRESAVHGGANHFDGGVARQDRRNQLPHERGIVND